MPDGLTTADVAGEISRHRGHHEEHDTGEDSGGGPPPSEERRATASASTTGPSPSWRRSSSPSLRFGCLHGLLRRRSGEPSPPSSSQPHPQLARGEPSRPRCDGHRNFDSTTFNTWFSAYCREQSAENVAERRFRPAFKVAFDAWMARTRYELVGTPGPTYMKQYSSRSWRSQTPWTRRPTRSTSLGPGRSQLRQLRARHHLSRHHSLPDRHQRALPLFRIRLALVSLGALMLLVAVAQILSSPAIRSRPVAVGRGRRPQRQRASTLPVRLYRRGARTGGGPARCGREGIGAEGCHRGIVGVDDLHRVGLSASTSSVRLPKSSGHQAGTG